MSEARELEKLGAQVKTGADEIPLSLFARAIQKAIKVYPQFSEPEYKDRISNYEDISIEQSVLGQLVLAGFQVVKSVEEADIILVVNNFKEKQGEHVMGWSTEAFSGEFIPPNKPYCVADVRFANGADNAFVEQLLDTMDLSEFYGYAGWNTSANTLGSLLACVKLKYAAKNYNENAFKKLQIIRFLDDWGYQANVRKQITNPVDISQEMKKYETKLAHIFNYDIKEVKYSYPWQRTFEIEINFQ